MSLFSEGAPASELKQSASFLRRATGGGDDKVKTKGPKATTTSNSSNAIKKLPPPKSKVLEEVQDMMMQSFDDPADDFSNLRKLISEVSVQSHRKIFGGSQTNFFGYGIVTIKMFEKKMFQIMCHMMGCNDSSG